MLILGGGFGGVMAAKTLLAKLPRGLSVTLVDKNEFHSFTSDFYEVATAFISEDFHTSGVKLQFRELCSSAAMLFADIFKGTPLTIIQDEIEHIDFEKKKVRLKQGKPMPYDYLLIALGSSTNFFGVPHLDERALELKSLQDALNIRNAADELFLTAPKHEVIHIVVAGGGFTGCELAGEMIGYLKKLSVTHAHPLKNIECSIVEGAPTLLGVASKWIQAMAYKRLTRLGIKIHFNSLITNVHEREIELKDGSRMPYDLLIWTAGIRPNAITEDLIKQTKQQKSCLMVDKNLLIQGQKNAYAIGDIAYCTGGESGERLPATAQLAISQGVHVARDILRRETGYASLPYRPAITRYVIPLGSKYALADMGRIRLSGWLAWALKRLVALHYFMILLPWGEAWKHWRGDLRIYSKNDE